MTADTSSPTPTTQAGRNQWDQHRIEQHVIRGLFGAFYMACSCGHRGPSDDATWQCPDRLAILAIEAEARDATGLREALARSLQAWFEDNGTCFTNDTREGRAGLPQELAKDIAALVMPDLRAALAAAPQEHVFGPSGGCSCGWDTGKVSYEEHVRLWQQHAEARDATGLREALDAHSDRLFRQDRHCTCGWFAGWEGGGIAAERRWADHREQAVRAALAAAPQEPRWPSRDELAKALHPVLCQPFVTVVPEQCIKGWPAHLELADAILAALREGAERP